MVTKPNEKIKTEDGSEYFVTYREEIPTGLLSWDKGILKQEWKILELRDYYCFDFAEYSYSGSHNRKEWRVVPDLNGEKTTKS